jgi:predicted acylesterase/phospholipase RssA
VAGTSAGSIVAALVGAGASPAHLRKAIDDLNFNVFLRPAQQRGRRGMIGTMLAWKYPEFAHLLFDQGFYSSSYISEWMNQILNRLLPNAPHPISFRSLPIPTYIVSTDLARSEAKVWSQVATPNELVANAVQASCAIPIFFQPIEDRYVDGGVLSNLPTFIFSGRENSDRPFSTRVLAFSLNADEEAQTAWGTVQFLKLLLNTIVDGSQKLQLDQQKDVHVIKISTGDVKATDFRRMTAALTQSLVDSGARAASKFFDEELQHVRSARPTASICYRTDELYTHVTDGLDIPLERVVIAENNTNWVYSLFPSLLAWVMKGVRLQVLLPEHGDSARHGSYRRRLLRALGVEVTELKGASSVPIRSYVLDSKDPARIKAVVGVERGISGHGIEAVVYAGVLDSPKGLLSSPNLVGIRTKIGTGLLRPIVAAGRGREQRRRRRSEWGASQCPSCQGRAHRFGIMNS